MVERCGYCDLIHDVGDSMETYNGARLKTCPMIPQDQVVAIAKVEPPPTNIDFFDVNDVIDI